MLWLNSFIRRLKLKRRKPYAILPLIVILLFISIGYAYLNATLSINGTSMLDSARWDVHFENIQVKNGSVTPTVEPIISNNTTVSFSVTLENPGDYYGFIIDVVNAGTLDAMIESISILPTLTERQQEYFDYSVPNCQYLSKWDVTKVNNMSYMFAGCISLNNASGIDNWNILSSANFTEMFKDSNVHPNFTRVVGTWDSNGTFTPS